MKRRNVTAWAILMAMAWLALASPRLAQASFLPGLPNTPPSAWAGLLAGDPAWECYKSRFLAKDGRIIDNGGGGVSHSEGQGYGMLLAVAANDRQAFDLIWRWTSANLATRGDHLFAWLYNPWANPNVGDLNSAADGDLLIAWALLEAGDAWGESSFLSAARGIALDIGRKEIIRQDGRTILLPGPKGFSASTRIDGPVVNLSYWIFPALTRLKATASTIDWDGLAASGLELIEAANFGPEDLPPEWMSLKDAPHPAYGLSCGFGYNSLRIPLYMALGGVTSPGPYARIAEAWRNGPTVFPHCRRTNSHGELTDPGYRELASLTQCIAEGPKANLARAYMPAPDADQCDDEQLYFPATIQLLTRIAIQTKWPACAAR